MAGRKRLGGETFKACLQKAMCQEGSVFQSEITVSIDGKESIVYVNFHSKTIIFTDPVQAFNYKSTIEQVDQQLKDKNEKYSSIDEFHLLMGLTGRGYSEQHIVMAYRGAKDNTLQLFDSKTSDIEKFFSWQPSSLAQSILTGLTGLLRSAQANYHFEGSALNDISISYHSLGTQSLFDGVSCGYFASGYILEVKSLIESGRVKAINAERLRLCNEAQLSMMDTVGDYANTVYKRFILKAWNDTYKPLKSQQDERFANYFLGWPKDKGIANKLFYFATLEFILKPAISLLRLPTEFASRAVAESADFVANEIYTWSPKRPVLQTGRSFLLGLSFVGQGMAKALALAIRTVIAPVDSFKAAKEIHPALAALSLTCTITAYTAIAIIAAPAAFHALTTLFGAGFLGSFTIVLTDLAWPMAHLFSGMNVVAAATTTLILASSLIAGLKAGARSLFVQKENKIDASNPIVSVKVSGENEDFVALQGNSSTKIMNTIGSNKSHNDNLEIRRESSLSDEKAFFDSSGDAWTVSDQEGEDDFDFNNQVQCHVNLNK